MKASVLLAHPYRGSFNHAIFETVCRVFREKCGGVRPRPVRGALRPGVTAEELGSTHRATRSSTSARAIVESDLLFFIHP